MTDFQLNLSEDVMHIFEELTDKTLKSSDKIKVARVIANMLGVDDAEKMSPEAAVNAGLKKMRRGRVTPEMVAIVGKMVGTLVKLGVKIDKSLMPKGMAEAKTDRVAEVDPSFSDNIARGILSAQDYANLSKMARGETVEVGHAIDDDDKNKKSHTLRHQKVRYHTEEVELDEEAKKMSTDADDISDDDLDDMVSNVDHEDALDAYENDELIAIENTGDDEDGDGEEDEKVHEIPSEEGIDEEMLSEVMTRMQRIRAAIRFKQTAGRRKAKLKIALKRRSDTKTLARRARKLAIKMVKERIGRKKLADMSVSEKERVEKILSQRSALINRLTLKMIPRVREIEQKRLSHHRLTKPAPGDI